MPLFEEDAGEARRGSGYEQNEWKEEKLAEMTAETLAILRDIEREKVRLLEELAQVAETQKALQAEMRRCERAQKKALEAVEEYTVPEDRELTLEDVERWCRSAFFNMAYTMPQNPHCYFSRKKSRNPEMYERVVAYVLEHGYPQKYGSRTYTVLDVRLNDGVWFLWPMTGDPSQSEILNLKPDSMRPEA